MKSYIVLLIWLQVILSAIYAAEEVSNPDDETTDKVKKVDICKPPKLDEQIYNPGGPPGGISLIENAIEPPKQSIVQHKTNQMKLEEQGAVLANELLAQVASTEEKAEEFDEDFSLKNPRKTMRLSAEIEVADLRPFAPQSDGGYIRFFFLDDLAAEIGKLPFAKLRRSPRIAISNDIVIPGKRFVIAYDFRNAKNEPLTGLHWTCNSVHNKEGLIEPFGIYEDEVEENKKQKRSIKNKINAVRLKAFIGGQSKEEPPIRMGFVACKYSEGAPLLKHVEKQELAPEKTMFDDVELITKAINKYGRNMKEALEVIDQAQSRLGTNNYMLLDQAQEIELPDYSLAIAGEYIRLTQQKYNKIVSRSDAPKLIALFRNYGVVTRATADELSEYLGLKE